MHAKILEIFFNFKHFRKFYWTIEYKKNKKKCYILTSIPSLFIMVASIFKIAVLMDLGGGNFVIPMLIAFDLLWFRTIISLFLFISCCFCLPTTNEKFSVISKHLHIIQPRHSLRYHFVALEVIAIRLVLLPCKYSAIKTHQKLQNTGTRYRFVKIYWQDILKMPLEWGKRSHSFDCKWRYICT